jgi:cell fate (sporulation/competence/biofilm development) regulator YlbF (YheA/YmcA/DUF963 family)
MKPKELAKQLGQSLAESQEYQNYHKAKQNLEGHEAAKTMLEDFRKKQWELERKKLNGDQLLQPHEDELRKLAEIIGLNPYIREYLLAEYQFTQIMMEVQRIIGEAVGLQMPDAEKLNGGNLK